MVVTMVTYTELEILHSKLQNLSEKYENIKLPYSIS